MKAIVCTKYGSADVLQLIEVEMPIPKDNEILIKVCVTAATAADCMMRQGVPRFGRLFLGLFKPKKSIVGTAVSGEIEAIGKNVTRFKVGDQVFGETGMNFAANAEYVCASADGVFSLKPMALSHAELAPVCDGALTSYSFLKHVANIKSGQKILINGASGGLGTSAVQLAKYFGAEVTAVCSAENIDLVKSLGADNVVDYTKEDFTKVEVFYDIVYDTVGKSSFTACKLMLVDDGQYISPVLSLELLFQMLKTSIWGNKKAKFSATGLRSPEELCPLLEEIKELFLKGNLKTVIDKEYSLEQTAQAHAYIDKGHKKGNVIITVGAVKG